VNEKAANDMGSPDFTIRPTDWQLAARSTTATPPAPTSPGDAAVSHDRRGVPKRPRRTALVVLAALALLGAVGTIVGFTTGDAAPADTSDLDAAITALTTERDGLTGQIEQLDGTIADLTVARDEAVAEAGELRPALDASNAEADRLTTRADELQAELDAGANERDRLTARVGELESTIAGLTIDLAALTTEVDGLEAERDALEAKFPVEFDGAFVAAGLVGTYDADYSETYRSGFTAALVPPAEVEISRTSQGYLVLEMDGFVTAGLFQIDGALTAVTSSTAAVPACDGSPRDALVAVSVFPHHLSADADGVVEISELGASITVHAPATAACPAGIAMYGARLAP
jgi:prefoldin subunit 5